MVEQGTNIRDIFIAQFVFHSYVPSNKRNKWQFIFIYHIIYIIIHHISSEQEPHFITFFAYHQLPITENCFYLMLDALNDGMRAWIAILQNVNMQYDYVHVCVCIFFNHVCSILLSCCYITLVYHYPSYNPKPDKYTFKTLHSRASLSIWLTWFNNLLFN